MQIPVTTSGRIHPYHPNMRPRLNSRGFRFTIFLVAFSSVFAQDATIIANNGEPIRVPYACSEDDLQWAGVSCDEDEPCPIFLELSSIVPDGRKTFVAGNLHSNSATLSTVLLITEDSGATWKESGPRIRGAALDQLQFYNLQVGWASGETQYPLARDPFFLVTTDGGASWRQKAVGEEGSAGSIQHFWFDSAQHGELIIDAGKASSSGRYISYESQTGGESWMIRGTSDRLPVLRRAPPSTDDPDWRFRPSKDGKAVQVEQRTNDQWKPLASFLIEAANCQTKATQLKEPEQQLDAPPAPATPKATDSKNDPKQKRKR
jgi:hypothetical protein